MNRISIAAGLVISILVLSVSNAEPPKNDAETTQIPLDEIWAYKMPGTRDITDIEDVPPAKRVKTGLMESSLMSSHQRAVKLKFTDLARPGFAVAGSGNSALRAAHTVFIDDAKPGEVFSPDEEITIVFFSEPISRLSVQIRQVTRKDTEIEIHYELQPDVNRGSHINFALIPLGKLPIGKYRVEMRQLPHELTPAEIKYGFKRLDEEWSRNFLCKSFSFAVIEKEK